MSTKVRVYGGAPYYREVSSRYGAPMGRASTPAGDIPETARLRMTRVPWVDGDYDPGGAYWGNNGTAIYCAWGADDVHGDPIEVYVRAASIEAAKAMMPGVRWTR